MTQAKLYMLLLGCRPKGRNTEQHDIFFAIGNSLAELVPAINSFWPEAKGNIHLDAWREVTHVDGYGISVIPRAEKSALEMSLFFINLGGYKEQEFEEYHYKILAVAKNLDDAKASAKQTAFYKHTGFKGAVSHIDDRFGVDADDVHEVKDILATDVKEKYSIQITPTTSSHTDEMHLGYLPVYKIPL
jgi:hypothetical protein